MAWSPESTQGFRLRRYNLAGRVDPSVQEVRLARQVMPVRLARQVMPQIRATRVAHTARTYQAWPASSLSGIYQTWHASDVSAGASWQSSRPAVGCDESFGGEGGRLDCRYSSDLSCGGRERGRSSGAGEAGDHESIKAVGRRRANF